MKDNQLRDYQQAMFDRLHQAWQRHRSVLVQMPTGTGKTVLMAEVIRSGLHGMKGGKKTACPQVLVVTHRRELIEQIEGTLRRYGIESLTSSPGLSFSPSLKGEGNGGGEGRKCSQVVVESIQKLSRMSLPFVPPHEEEGNGGAVFCPNLIIIDEAHHALAKTYRQLWERWPEARFLGLTATPCRLSGEPFTELFDVLLQAQPIGRFIEQGWLSDFEYASAAPDSAEMRKIRELRKRGADGDYQQKELVTVMDVPESIAHLYDTYRQFALGKKGIVYAIDRQHAQHIAEYYIKKGVSCAVIDSKTPAAVRQKTVEDYRRQTLDVLVNVDIFGEGFDVPEVEFIQLARPTLSLNKYLQQVGRGMRVSPGKPHVLILDNVGLYQTFGLPTDERDWQPYFTGKLSGKGVQQSRPVVVDLEELDCKSSIQQLGIANPQQQMEELGIANPQQQNTDDQYLTTNTHHPSPNTHHLTTHRSKELVNLEMVRIKRRGEKHVGVEVILQDGLYGIMYNGNVTCQPRYERVRPLKDGGEFFALADYPQKGMNGRRTVINYQGVDLQMALYGDVRREGDFFIGKNIRGERCYWDGQGREYYKEMPTFKRCGGIDLKPFQKGRYRLRRWPNLFTNGVKVEDILSNKDIAIIGNQVLVVKSKPQRVYTIFGYRSDRVLVTVGMGKMMMEISKDGTAGNITAKRVPADFCRYPSYYEMQLRGTT